MTITLADSNAAALHILGGTPATLSLTDISNDAGRELMNMRAWAWAGAVMGTADFAEDVDSSALPAAFLRFTSTPRLTGGALTRLNMVSMNHIERLRSGVAGGGDPWWGALYHELDGTDVLLPRISLYPTPSAAATPGLTFTYVSGWTDLALDADIVRIPEFLIPLYRDVVRAVARGWEDDFTSPGQKQAYLVTVEGGSTYARAAETDRAFQQSFGTVRGGVGATTAFGRTLITLA